VLRGVINQCQRNVNKHKNTYHIVYVFGNYYIVTTKHYQQSLRQLCELDYKDIQLVKTQDYYDIERGKRKKPKKYKSQNTEVYNSIVHTINLMHEREDIDLTTKQGKLAEKGLRRIIKQRIREIKKRLRGMKQDG